MDSSLWKPMAYFILPWWSLAGSQLRQLTNSYVLFREALVLPNRVFIITVFDTIPSTPPEGITTMFISAMNKILPNLKFKRWMCSILYFLWLLKCPTHIGSNKTYSRILHWPSFLETLKKTYFKGKKKKNTMLNL